MVQQLVLKNAPENMPVFELGKSDSTFELQTFELPELKDGQVLIQPVFYSNDPAQRGWIQKDWDEKRAYVAPVREGQRMRAGVVAKVLKSKDTRSDEEGKVKEGALVQTYAGWVEQDVVEAKDVVVLPTIPGLSPSVFLGALGGPGLTAYFGLKDILQLKEGQSIIVSAAAGATGNVVVQLAKHVFKASKVIAIAGSQEKCDWLRKIGADVAINYKSPTFLTDLESSAGPSYVECFFDGVGGSVLNACLPLIKKYGRVAACGAIAAYNDKSQMVLDNYFEIISNRLTVQGFIVIDYLSRRAEAISVLGDAVKEGQLKVDGGETVVRCAFEEIPTTWRKLFTGENTGKLVTQVADL